MVIVDVILFLLTWMVGLVLIFAMVGAIHTGKH